MNPKPPKSDRSLDGRRLPSCLNRTRIHRLYTQTTFADPRQQTQQVKRKTSDLVNGEHNRPREGRGAPDPPQSIPCAEFPNAKLSYESALAISRSLSDLYVKDAPRDGSMNERDTKENKAQVLSAAICPKGPGVQSCLKATKDMLSQTLHATCAARQNPVIRESVFSGMRPRYLHSSRRDMLSPDQGSGYLHVTSHYPNRATQIIQISVAAVVRRSGKSQDSPRVDEHRTRVT